MSFALCYGVSSLFFSRRGNTVGRRLVTVHLEHMGSSTDFKALYDTGNSLSDPVSGCAVMLVCPHVLKAALPELSPVELLQYADSREDLKGRFRLISYKAVGGSGLLAAFRPDYLSIDGKERSDVLIALCDEARGDGFLGIF